MKGITVLNVFTIAVGAVMLTGCAHSPSPVEKYSADMAACVSPKPPTDEEIRRMPTRQLYEFWQLSRRAAHEVAHASVVSGYSVDPCVRALAWKEIVMEQELQYR